MSKLYKMTIKKKKEKAEEFIYGAENNREIITKFLHTMDEIIGEEINKIEYFKWEIEKE